MLEGGQLLPVGNRGLLQNNKKKKNELLPLEQILSFWNT